MKHVTTKWRKLCVDAVVGAEKACNSHAAAKDKSPQLTLFSSLFILSALMWPSLSLSNCDQTKFTKTSFQCCARCCLFSKSLIWYISEHLLNCLFPYLCFRLQLSHTFTDYGPGLHYITFEHGGQDTKFWDGWFGVRVTGSSVTVDVWMQEMMD